MIGTVGESHGESAGELNHALDELEEVLLRQRPQAILVHEVLVSGQLASVRCGLNEGCMRVA